MRKAREGAGISVGALADELGVSRKTVGNYENGHTRPRRAVLAYYAMRTQVPIIWLEYGVDPPLPRPDSDREPAGVGTVTRPRRAVRFTRAA